MGTERQRIERWVNVVVGKPMTWLLYGSWLAAGWPVSAVQRGVAWLRRPEGATDRPV